MNHLISVIGLAPSELSWNDLLKKLRIERERVRQSFETWAKSKGLKKAKAPSQKREITSLKRGAKSIGLSIEEIEKILSKEVERRKRDE